MIIGADAPNRNPAGHLCSDKLTELKGVGTETPSCQWPVDATETATKIISKLRTYKLRVQLPTKQAAQIGCDASYANETANGDNRIYGATSVRLLGS